MPLEFDEAVRISVGSMHRMTEAWAASDLPDGAAMVVTTSVAGNLVGTESDWYSASKAAVMGYVDEVAYAALFLPSPLAGYINGAFLPVDGGWTVTQ